MQEEQTTRRRFLIAALTFSGAGAMLGSGWLKPAAVWAATPEQELATLGRMAQWLFPHEGLADAAYGEIIGDILDSAASDPALGELLDTAAAALDTARNVPWLELDDEDQLAVLEQLQDAPFFAGIREAVRFRLYYHPGLWEHIGYPGSSKELGGYLHRGFDDIDWLPEAE